MALTTFTYFFTVRDHSQSPAVRMTGLTPTWIILNAATNNDAISTSVAVISEVGEGIYKVTYDVEQYGEAVGQIDAGSSLSLTDDRYIDMSLTGYVKVDLTQAVGNSCIDNRQTVGSGLLGADSDAFSKQQITSDTWNKYSSDNVTVLRAFTLDSNSAPTERT